MEAIDIVLEGAIKLGVNKKGQSELIKFVLDNPKYHYSIVTNHRNLTHIMHDISGLMRDDEFFVPRVLFDDDNEYKKIGQMEENNKLIAEFMGMELGDDKTVYYDDAENLHPPTPINKLKFHESWNWLMPVVEKIEFEHDCLVIINSPLQVIITNKDIGQRETPLLDSVFEIEVSDMGTKRDCLYKAVVEFINEYNRKDGSN